MALHSGIDQSEFSPTVRPQDDFFRYVSGPWAESHVIPDDRAADGSFYTLRDEAEKHTRAIIEAAEPESQIGGLYASFMDVERVNALGTTPLEEDFVAIADAQDRTALAVTMGALQRTGVAGAVGYYVFADKNDPDTNVVYLSQYGLGLPDEAYYREDAHADTREKYVAHIDRMAELTGVGFTGQGVMALETALASHHWDNVKTREAELTHNPTTLDRLVAEAPGFDWRAWADAIHLPEAAHDLLIASEPSFFEAFAQLWAETDVADWQAYLRWRVVNSRAPYLTEEISQANFSFYGTVLSGATQQRERWKRGVGFVEAVAGELVGQEYVKAHFPPTHKEHMDRLVANLIEAYRQSITQLDWMTPSTKQRALDKLAQFTPKIGYPEKWRDFTDLEVSPHDLVGNMRSSSTFDEDWEWSKIGKPVDRSEWLMTPQTVNAYYLPLANEIAFPAAILQPPFFHPEADDAVNYGGIGSVIGHEIGHGFDDQGSKYDGRGKLEDWWTEADRAAFMERANRLIEQYSGYSPQQLSDEHVVNGALTVGENIGDLAGVEIALKAYEISLGHPIADAPDVDGLTATQRFFIGYALTERMVTRDEALVTRLAMDPHSPSEFRVNGIVRNVGAWYEAFEVTEEDELWLAPEARVSIW
ncbi:M13 family metallopeptidase [Demequina aestuarii]|uniref:M13 family metallopeptidase n=1 Tax=Demequina aestuarii TaxID=327095 RepID=UPI000785E676|nr:M13-type metalloendopeptidase [Demequina aestuarii]